MEELTKGLNKKLSGNIVCNSLSRAIKTKNIETVKCFLDWFKSGNFFDRLDEEQFYTLLGNTEYIEEKKTQEKLRGMLNKISYKFCNEYMPRCSDLKWAIIESKPKIVKKRANYKINWIQKIKNNFVNNLSKVRKRGLI
jgi:hypothetical protein